MSFRSLTSAELDLGIDRAFKKYGCTIMRTNLYKMSEKLLSFRYEGMSFEQALRTTLDTFKLTGERREWYKTAFGAAFSSRARLMHKGKVPKRSRPQRLHPGCTVDANGQYSFPLSP